ncbi:diaminopimelate epimerase [Heyndrickxia ginsengihumi]|uniref:Diaminopimelate epimerase n=1 Tax=Heyndrickxia ginsengihumi TaxID=363870 RepID=A0A6M0P6F3_9BACI|nr:diaminopimelate epimerase [Heyndrickxia ginsengihumi]MBE6185332.1 diaminopimelate epimerase [Bacillus sp. (in: firmicutes)]MCM3023691.1 diaminopimelate epimerase [Heyndrickxia ginsengihumi]NEY19855.1 diaminopimelate epimerase [Heyndrickxia ginsengihumi]
MNIKLIKSHGSGNDFFIIDELSNNYHFTDTDRKQLALALCNRNTALGADGILFVSASDVADAQMRVFNADGSEASMCGNGLRCVGRYVCDLLEKDDIIVETKKANLYVKKAEPIFGEIPTYRVEISPVLFELEKLPMNIGKQVLINEQVPELDSDLTFTAVAVPNPHLITFVDNDMFKSSKQKTLSEYVNGPNDIFPDGVNVSFVKFLKKGELYVRTFERGVGFTNACGTAMSASSLVSCLLAFNDYEEAIDVYNNGGKVRCLVHKQDDKHYGIDLIGNATYLYDATITIELNNPTRVTINEKNEYSEQDQYAQLETFASKYIEKELSI